MIYPSGRRQETYCGPAKEASSWRRALAILTLLDGEAKRGRGPPEDAGDEEPRSLLAEGLDFKTIPTARGAD